MLLLAFKIYHFIRTQKDNNCCHASYVAPICRSKIYDHCMTKTKRPNNKRKSYNTRDFSLSFIIPISLERLSPLGDIKIR